MHAYSFHRKLDGVHRNMEVAAGNLAHISKRTKDLVEKAGGPRPCTVIVFLSTAAIILLLLVLYT